MIHQLLGWLEHADLVLLAVFKLVLHLNKLMIALLIGISLARAVWLALRPARRVSARSGRKVSKDRKRSCRRRPRSNNQT
jgi:hypothetical protein